MDSARSFARVQLPLGAVAAVVLGWGSGPSAQSVLVVDAAGGTPFATLQAAVDAAAPGDTVLVRGGDYAGVTIDRALSLVADEGAAVRVAGTVTVESLNATDWVRVHGVAATAAGFPVFPVLPALVVRNCLGTVWVEDSAFTAGFTPLGTATGGAITDCTAVVLQDTAFAGASAGPGLRVERAAVHAFGGSATGGISGIGTAGGPGLDLLDATAYLQGSTARGGPGLGAGPVGGGCHPAGHGGVGARMSGGGSVLRTVGSTLEGGAGGLGFSFCGPGNPGLPTEVLGGFADLDLAAAVFRFEAAPVAREGGAIDFTLTGTPGEPVILMFGFAPQPIWLAVIKAPLLPEVATFVAIPLGNLPASGTLSLPAVVPELGPGIQFVRWFAQVLAPSTIEGPLGGYGQAQTLLDSAF
jgi:hypothetical protein